MKKNKFIQSTILLLIGGFITKILGMVIKIITTRMIQTEGIGIYMLITPTFMLFITIAQLGFPIAISKLVSEETKDNKKLILSLIPFSLMVNLITMFLIFIISPIISEKLLHDNRCLIGLYSIAFVLPFISISSIMRGYFFGKERMFPHIFSNIMEDVIRIIVLIIGIPYFIPLGIPYTVGFLIISNIFSELTSILILYLFLPKKITISKKDFIGKKEDIKEVFQISLPTTIGRLIGSIGYFLEPIILTSTLIYVGYKNNFIVYEYGIISGYVIPLLLLPSFFTMAISQALIPEISRNFSRKKYNETKTKLKHAIIFSLIIGIPFTILVELFPEFFLKLIYNSNEGITYLRVLAPICLLQYIQSPLTSALQAMGKAKSAMNGTLGGTIIRTVFLFLLSLMKIGLWGLILATSINIIYVTIHQIKCIKKELNDK